MVAHGVEIRVERTGPFDRRDDAEQLMQVMGRVPDVGSHGHGRRALAQPPVRPHHGRKGRHRGHRIIQGVLLATEAEHGRRHSQRIHRRRLCSRGFVKDGRHGPGQRPPPGQIPGESGALGFVRQAAVQQQVRHVLERRVRRQIFDGVAGDGQPARLSIHMTDPRRCGNDVFESFAHTHDG